MAGKARRNKRQKTSHGQAPGADHPTKFAELVADNLKPDEPVPSTHPLLPPLAANPSVLQAYNVHTITVRASDKIESRVRQVISVLEPAEGSKSVKPKPPVVCLLARSTAANKSISVVEIAKRELGKIEGARWRQYTGYWMRLELFSKKKTRASDGKNSGEKDGEDEVEEEDAFASLPTEDKPTLRSIPCLVIYLTMQSVPKLKELYSEQAKSP